MIGIVDYRAGNLTSVRLAVEAIGAKAVVVRAAAAIADADALIFPGVGAAASAMRALDELEIREALRAFIASGRPFLGICLGTQILLERSEEDGGVSTLGVLAGEAIRFRPTDARDKVPHMGWNAVRFTRAHPLLAGVDSGTAFYFVHSYRPAPREPAVVLGVTDYAGSTFPSMLGRGNLAAAQFHPEKSGKPGLRMLANFCGWNGRC